MNVLEMRTVVGVAEGSVFCLREQLYPGGKFSNLVDKYSIKENQPYKLFLPRPRFFILEIFTLIFTIAFTSRKCFHGHDPSCLKFNFNMLIR